MARHSELAVIAIVASIEAALNVAGRGAMVTWERNPPVVLFDVGQRTARASDEACAATPRLGRRTSTATWRFATAMPIGRMVRAILERGGLRSIVATRAFSAVEAPPPSVNAELFVN